jgi:RIO1 family
VIGEPGSSPPAAPARILPGRRRRRPSGEPPPLPRRIGVSGLYWVGLGGLVVCAWLVVTLVRGDVVVDQKALEWVAGVRSAAVTDLMLALHGLGSRWVIVVLDWAAVLVLLGVRRFRHLFVFLGAMLVVQGVADGVSSGIAEVVEHNQPPAGVAVLAHFEGSLYPMLPVATLAASLVCVLYTLVPQGRLRQAGKWVAFGIVALLAVARIYLAVDTPTGVVIAAIIGVTIPLVAFRLLTPAEVFPVAYRRGRGAHLDVGGARGAAIRRALEDQLGLVVVDVRPVGLAGSAGSTPLRVTVKGEHRDTYLFAKLYAKNHLRADRWYKLGRTLLYGRLEDEEPFRTVRRLVQQEDYALALMQRAGLPSPRPFGVVELTPGREYIVVTEFFDRAREIGDPEVEVDDQVIDNGLRVIRALWDASLAHRDIKPANLMVRDGEVLVIDVFFAEVCPSPWRQAVDLANMLLVLGLRNDPKRVYERALVFFTVDEISEAFAATRGLTMPSQLRRMMRAQGRDLHADFIRLLPEPPRPISIQRWSTRRILLTISVLFGAVLVFAMVVSSLQGLGLQP